MEKPQIKVEEYHTSDSPHRTLPTVSVAAESELQLCGPPPPPPTVPPPPLTADNGSSPGNSGQSRHATVRSVAAAKEPQSQRFMELCGAHCCHSDLTVLPACEHQTAQQLLLMSASTSPSPNPNHCSVLLFEPHAHWARSRSLRAPPSHFKSNPHAAAIACGGGQRGVPIALYSPCEAQTLAFDHQLRLQQQRQHECAQTAAATATASGAPTLITSPHAHLIFSPTSISVPLARTHSGASAIASTGSRCTSTHSSQRSDCAPKTSQSAGGASRKTARTPTTAAGLGAGAGTGAPNADANDESGSVRFCVGGVPATATTGVEHFEEVNSTAEAVRLCGALGAADAEDSEKAALTKGQKRVSRAVVVVSCMLLLLSVALIAFTLAISEHIDQMGALRSARELSLFISVLHMCNMNSVRYVNRSIKETLQKSQKQHH